MQNIQEHYFKKVEKIYYKEYSQLILLFCKLYDKVKKYTGIQYYTMIDKKNTMIWDKLIKI